MALLNKFSLNEITYAITNNDKKSISSVQGIGQKMTERIILELKSKGIILRSAKDGYRIKNNLRLTIGSSEENFKFMSLVKGIFD